MSGSAALHTISSLSPGVINPPVLLALQLDDEGLDVVVVGSKSLCSRRRQVPEREGRPGAKRLRVTQAARHLRGETLSLICISTCLCVAHTYTGFFSLERQPISTRFSTEKELMGKKI